MKKKIRLPNLRPFTLLEILLVAALVAMAFSVCALQIPKAIRSEAFSQSVEKLIAKLELTQEMMLDFNADLSLKLIQEDKKALCSLIVEKGKIDERSRSLKLELPLEGVTSFVWKGARLSILTLPFRFSEHDCPHGVLTLKGPDREISLYLPGHPGKILKTPKEVVIKEIQAPYPEGIL